jgi:penicillin-binding protein 1A
VAPIQMARAFAVFGNQGREVTPIAIRAVEDRNGRLIMDPEKELRLQQKRKGSAIQVITQQNAYVMTSLLEKTVESGTLAWASGYGSKFTFRDKDGKKYTIPAAGKTGTTQNWGTLGPSATRPTIPRRLVRLRPARQLARRHADGSPHRGPGLGGLHAGDPSGPPRQGLRPPHDGLIDVTVCARSAS